MSVLRGLALAGILATFGSFAMEAAADGVKPATPAPLASPWLKLASDNRELKREALFQCCQRHLRGQSLIGFYCSPSRLNSALKRRQVIINTGPNGRRSCAPGFGV